MTFIQRQNRTDRFAQIIIVIIAFLSVLLSAYSIALSIQTQPLQINPTGNTAFDIPTDIPLEESLPLPGTENAYDQIEHKKATIDQETTPEETRNNANYWEYPAEIRACTKDGNDLLVLVNKSYQLPSSYSPTDLVPVENSGVRATKSSLTIRSIIVPSLTELNTAIRAEGIDMAILSAFRSYQTQQNTYAYWVNYNGGSVDAADQVSARPGHSQHQLGTAVDFTTSEIGDQLGQQFADTAAGRWLAEHAWEYGFILAYPRGAESITGYSYEPWHFRYIGKENAEEWRESGLTLEEWLREKN